MDIVGEFRDVKYVCMGGSPVRAGEFAAELQRHFGRLGVVSSSPAPPEPVGKTERFSLYKVGPIISASHGIGMPSMLVVMHELAKLLHYAGASDAVFVRIGTSGGIGSEPGVIIISDKAVIGTLEPSTRRSNSVSG